MSTSPTPSISSSNTRLFIFAQRSPLLAVHTAAPTRTPLHAPCCVSLPPPLPPARPSSPRTGPAAARPTRASPPPLHGRTSPLPGPGPGRTCPRALRPHQHEQQYNKEPCRRTLLIARTRIEREESGGRALHGGTKGGKPGGVAARRRLRLRHGPGMSVQ